MMKKPTLGKIIYLLAICSFALLFFSKAYKKKDIENPIPKPEKREIVIKLADHLEKYYVFPEKGVKMANLLKKNLQEEKYDQINSYDSLANELTLQLRNTVNDKHLRIRVNNTNNAGIPTLSNVSNNDDFGITSTKVLEGNVGYLAFNTFPRLNSSSEKAVAAIMSSLKDTESIIIDLRENGGGDPSMVQLYCSYFFNDKPVHLNSLYFRPENITRDFYTFKNIKGKRMPKKPLYILTSDFTFSGAEEFCYNLKNLKRAIIIGEVTGGGAHPVNAYQLNDHLTAIIPIGRAINPITNTNWEQTGVKPDKICDSKDALKIALLMARN